MATGRMSSIEFMSAKYFIWWGHKRKQLIVYHARFSDPKYSFAALVCFMAIQQLMVNIEGLASSLMLNKENIQLFILN